MTNRGAISASLIGVIMLALAVRADDVFIAHLRVTAKSVNSNDKLASSHITDKSIITAATGVRDRTLLKNFALVYNASTNALQVVDNSGNLITNVMFFSGGAFTSGTKNSSELTFIFLPDQTEASGSAVINEKAAKTQTQTTKDKVHVTGALQFFLVGDQVLGRGTTNGAVASGVVVEAPAAVTDTSTEVPSVVIANAKSFLKWYTVNTNGTITITGSPENPSDTNAVVTVTTNSDGSLTILTNSVTGGGAVGVTITTSTNSNGTVSAVTNLVSLPGTGIGGTNTVDTSGTDASAGGTALATADTNTTPATTTTSTNTAFFSLLSVAPQANANVRICTGHFTAGRRFLPGSLISTNGLGTNTNTVVTTNTPSLVTSTNTTVTTTNGVTTTNTTGTATGTTGTTNTTTSTTATTGSGTVGTLTGSSGTLGGTTGTTTVP